MTPLDLLARLLLIIAAAYAAWYLLKCVVAPWGVCRRCDGKRYLGRFIRRPCPRCRGYGIRVRVGRRLYRYLRREISREYRVRRGTR